MVRFAILAAEKIRKQKLAKPQMSPRQLFTVQAMLVVAVYGYGLFEAADIRLERIEIASPKITEQTGRIRIAQISDVHLGLIVREGRLNRILARIREAQPDILVSTGDLVDGQLNHLTKEAGLLAAVNPPLGKFAITGNHEFYAGLQDALDFTEKSGFTLLRQQGMVVSGINIVGVDDPAVRAFDQEPARSERDASFCPTQGEFHASAQAPASRSIRTAWGFLISSFPATPTRGRSFPSTCSPGFFIPNGPAGSPD